MASRSSLLRLDQRRMSRLTSSTELTQLKDAKQLETMKFIYSSEVETALSDFKKNRQARGLPMSAATIHSRDSYGYKSHPFSIKILKLPQLYSDMMFMKRKRGAQSLEPPDEEDYVVDLKGSHVQQSSNLPSVDPQGKLFRSATNTYLTETVTSSKDSEISEDDSTASTRLPSFSTRSHLSTSSWSTSTVPRYMRKATSTRKPLAAYYNKGFQYKQKKQVQKIPVGLDMHGNRRYVHAQKREKTIL